MKEIPKALLEFIKSGSAFIVAGHEEPDGDCVGSQLALCSLLERMGKKAIPCSAGPFKRTEVKPYERRFLPCPADTRGFRVLVTDCSDRERLGALSIEGLPSAVIDHHASGNPWGNIVYLDAASPSVTLMVEKIFRALDMKPTPEEAELLLFGLCTDTGFFRHLDKGSAETFSAVSRLVAAGASPKKMFGMMYGGKPLNSRRLMGIILSRVRPYFDGRLLVSDETAADMEHYGCESRDSDMLFQLLQAAENVEAIVLLREENSAECTMGFRSRDRIDVGAIAASFGGGGHKNAAGAKAAGTIAELETRVTEAFTKWF